MRTWFLYGASAFLLAATSCVVSTDDDDDDDTNTEAGETSTGGRDATTGGRTSGGSSGSGGDGDGTGEGGAGAGAGGAGEGGSGGTITGGTTGEGGEGGSGEGGAGPTPEPTDCEGAEPIPEIIEEDLSVGPGCVRIDRTHVYDGAKLTIAPGTRVQFAPAGFLHIAESALSAVGTEDEPIVFTSEAASPTPGDWQCVHIERSSSDVDIQYATFEYGGDDCAATGAGHQGMLQLDAAARNVSNNTFQNSLTHGVKILPSGNVRAFENNAFAENEAASIDIAAPQLLVLGEGLSFADEDDYIRVNTTFGLGTTGTWLAQPVPFRLVGGFAIGDMAEVTLQAGLRIELDGSSFEVFNGNMIVAGTEEAPVTFTSSFEPAGAGDWGCVTFSSPTGTPRFDYAVLEYAGNGQGCTGANYEGALVVPDSAIIRNTTFREISGFAIRSSECNVDDWCDNTFESVDTPLTCGAPSTATACE